jgi:hypothetical protein
MGDDRMKMVVLAIGLLVCAALAGWLWTPDLSRSLLESRYLVAPTDMVQVGGWRLHVRDSGPRDAAPLILIHGFGSSLQTWDRWTTQLDRKTSGHPIRSSR